MNVKLELSSAHVKIQRVTDEKHLGCLELLGGGLQPVPQVLHGEAHQEHTAIIQLSCSFSITIKFIRNVGNNTFFKTFRH